MNAMKHLTHFFLAAAVACSGSSTGTTPSEEDDLVGGKDDTGYVSNLATELDGVFESVIRLDMSGKTEEERLELLREYQEQPSWQLSNLIDEQLKFGKNALNQEKLHINLSSSGGELI